MASSWNTLHIYLHLPFNINKPISGRAVGGKTNQADFDSEDRWAWKMGPNMVQGSSWLGASFWVMNTGGVYIKEVQGWVQGDATQGENF